MKAAIRSMLVVLCFMTIAQLSYVRAQQDTTVNDKDMIVSDFEDIGYPPLARQTRTQGVVVVRVRLDKDGKVEDAKALSGSELLISASITNAKKWHFQPNSQRAAVIVYNFRMPFADCKSQSIKSFSILQAPNFVTITGCETPVQP